MKKSDKYIAIVSKLNRLTKEEGLDWSKCPPPAALKSGLSVIWVDFYKIYYEGIIIGVGEARYENYSDEFDRMYWTGQVEWMLLDSDDSLEYEFPSTEGLWNLLESIRYSYADVDNTIDTLLDALEKEV